MNFVAHLGLTFLLAILLVGTILPDVLKLIGQDPNLSLMAKGLFVLIMTFSALVPDIDTDESFISRLMVVVVIIVLAVAGFIWYGLSQTMLLLVIVGLLAYLIIKHIAFPKHRGYTHGLVFALLWGILIYYETGTVVYGIAGFGGLTAHMLEDGMIQVL